MPRTGPGSRQLRDGLHYGLWSACLAVEHNQAAVLKLEGISVLANDTDECRHIGLELSLSSQCFVVAHFASCCLCCCDSNTCKSRVNSGPARSHLWGAAAL